MQQEDTIILGAGMTGLAAGMTSGWPVIEAERAPGGICSSYYVSPSGDERLAHAPANGEAYRFEKGGGHWIFGQDSEAISFIERMCSVRKYSRRSSVFFHDRSLFVPYPLQNNLRFLPEVISQQAVQEITGINKKSTTMHEWLSQNFGETLCSLFFDPFHEVYTAGLYKKIAPQDAYKSPVDVELVRQGAQGGAPAVGYNATFLYPKEGLDLLSLTMAQKCDIRYGKRITQINPFRKKLSCSDGTQCTYEKLISTLPLNRMLEMTGLSVESRADPYTSVLVLNIGAERGEHCPDDHWVYVPKSKAGFHRVGFYSNVDEHFLPSSVRGKSSHVSLYIERAYLGGEKPSMQDIAAYTAQVVTELQEWGFIGNVEVVDPSWINVAYTWSWPNSKWREEAIALLRSHDIHQVGRYGQWQFQGIVESLREGMGCRTQECSRAVS